MNMFSRIALASPAVIGAAALSLTTVSPAEAQSRYNDRDRDRGNSTQDALIGAAVGGLAGALLGNGEGSYVIGGALAGAALGAASNRGSDCEYYRGGRCYRNVGHWEREHGINSREASYGYRYGDQRYEGRRAPPSRNRDYRYDRRW